MSIEPKHQNLQEPKDIVALTQAIINVLGIKSADQADKIQSASIFLIKLFRKYSPMSGNKFHQIKLSRLNGFFYKVCQEPPRQIEDIDVVNQIIYIFLNNQGSSPMDDSSYTSNSCELIARYIQQVLANKFPASCIEVLSTVLKIKPASVIDGEKYQKILLQSNYFRDKEITKSDQENANKEFYYKGFMTQFEVDEEIKQYIKIKSLFSALFQNHINKKEVIQLFMNYCRCSYVQEAKQIYVDVFISNGKNLSQEILKTILSSLDSELFTGADFNQIIKLLLSTVNTRFLYSFASTNQRLHKQFMEILGENMKVGITSELVDIFIKDHSVNNYYLLYLIQRSNQILSPSYLKLPADNAELTNRYAIISALSVSHNIDQAHDIIIKNFFDNEHLLTNKTKINYLKLMHFSYMYVPRSHLFTHIIKSVSHSELDRQSNFQFLPKGGYQKLNLSKDKREKLNDFLSRYFGNNDQIYEIKLDLYSICGKPINYTNEFKKIQRLFQLPFEKSLSQLPQLTDNIEVALMGMNNKSGHFLFTQLNLQPIQRWGAELLKSQKKRFKNLCESYLKRQNSLPFVTVLTEIFFFNLELKTDLQLGPQFNSITTIENKRRLKDLNFSEYFLMQQTSGVPEEVMSLLRSKHTLIQLSQFNKLLTKENTNPKEAKLSNEKDKKKDESTSLWALKILSLLSQNPLNKYKSVEDLQKLVEQLLYYVKTDFESITKMGRSAKEINSQFYQISDSFEFLTNVTYEKSLLCFSRILASVSQNQIKSKGKIEEKSGRKGRKRGEAVVEQIQGEDKMLQNLIEKVQFCFKGDPNSLKSYDPIISILNQIKEEAQNQRVLVEILKWVSKIKIFHKSTYGEWKVKVQNYVKLLKCLEEKILTKLDLLQIERHFLMLVDLLNTLYEKYKNERDSLSIEKKILNSLYILYSISLTDKIDEEEAVHFPIEKLNQIFTYAQPPETTTAHIFNCYDCSKRICHQCAVMIHRNHDKTYIGPGNLVQCHQISLNKPKQEEKNRERKHLNAKDNYSLQRIERQAAERLAYQRYGDLGLKQKYYLLKKYERPLQPSNQFIGFQVQQEQNQIVPEDKKPKQEQQNSDIKSCSQKQFTLKPVTSTQQVEEAKPVFQIKSERFFRKRSKINLQPLLNLFTRQLRSNTFCFNVEVEIDQKHSSLYYEVEILNQKYTMLKNESFKSYAPPNIRSAYLMNQQPPNSLSLLKRNSVCINQKFFTILSGGLSNQLFCLDSNLFKTKFLKKQSEKKYKDVEVIESFLYSQSKISEPSILQTVFSPYANNLIAEISPHKILFEHISKEGKNRTLCFEQSHSDIIKFEWLKASGLKSYFAYLCNQLIITRLDRRESTVKIKIAIEGKRIKDFSNTTLNSKMVFFSILDNEGKIYRSKFDISSRRLPNFKQFQINLNLSPTDQVISISSHGSWNLFTTNTGKIVVANLSQQNAFIRPPVICPVIENIKNHKLSETNNKIKEMGRIGKLRFITKHQNDIFLCCLLMKQGSQGKKIGNFAILTINIQNQKSKIILLNDQGLTDSFDFIPINEKEYFFVCLQEDGQIWSHKLNVQFKNTLKNCDQNLIAYLSPNDVSKYATEINRYKMMQKVKFENKDRYYTFKQHAKITDHFKVKFTNNEILIQIQEKSQKIQFPTGIDFLITLNPDDPSRQVMFSFIGNLYKYKVNKSRQIQIALTIKQIMSLYLQAQQFKIVFHNLNPSEVIAQKDKDFNIYGIKISEKTAFSEPLTALCELAFLYLNPKQINLNDKKLERFFFNQFKMNFCETSLKGLQQYFNKKKFSLAEQNLLLKLQFFRESLQNFSEEEQRIYECFDSIRSHVLPNCYDRRELIKSAHKLCCSFTFASKNIESGKLGHPLNFSTQLDLFSISKKFETFKNQVTAQSFQDLINELNLIINNRTANSYIIFISYPQLVSQVCKFFKKLIVDNKVYFKFAENGLQKDDKIKLNKLCNSVIKIMVEGYHVKKNLKKNTQKEQDAEWEFISQFQNIFCPQKKQIHREIKLNHFKFLQPNFLVGQYAYLNPPIDFQRLLPIQQTQLNINEDQAVIPPSGQQANVDYILPEEEYEYINDCDEEIEEHKQQEEAQREMIDQLLAYENVRQREDGLPNQTERISAQNLEKQSQCLKISDKKMIDNIKMATSQIVTQQNIFDYQDICQNLLLKLFTEQLTKNLNGDNLVFYVGLMYSLLQGLQKKLSRIFSLQQIGANSSYLSESVFPLMQAIDQKIDSPSHSILYLPLNSLINKSFKNENLHSRSYLIDAFKLYYKKNIGKSKLLWCLIESKWHPQQTQPIGSLNSVMRFTLVNHINPIYQVKFVGNVLSHLLDCKISQIEKESSKIKENVLRVYVKYGLNVYFNLMMSHGWEKQLQRAKIDVAFQNLSRKSEESLRVIKQSGKKNPKSFYESIKQKEERIQVLESVLGRKGDVDILVLEILHQYYSFDPSQK